MQIQNILNYLEASAASYPEKAAFEDLEHSFTFAQVLANARRMGSALAEELSPNAPVPVFMEKEAWTLSVLCFVPMTNAMSGWCLRVQGLSRTECRRIC